ncbi:MAG: SusF/SusE family outer membrane protein [Bacteroidota bacterium]
MKTRIFKNIMKYALLLAGVALTMSSCEENEYDIPGGPDELLLEDGYYLHGEGSEWPELTMHGAFSESSDGVWELTTSFEEGAEINITSVKGGEFTTHGPGDDVASETLENEDGREYVKISGSVVESSSKFRIDKEGKYDITINVDEMTIDIEENVGFFEELYMIGDVIGGWSWDTDGIEMVPVHSHKNLFWQIVWMEAGEDLAGFKFAPEEEWGNDFGMEEDLGGGEYSFGGNNTPAPEESGYYMVVVDLEAEKFSVAEPEVYLIGNTIGGWDTADESGLFTQDKNNQVLRFEGGLENADLRMYAWHEYFEEWWQSEFMIFDEEIVYRGTGDDQDRVEVEAGDYVIELDFVNGTGVIEQQ